MVGLLHGLAFCRLIRAFGFAGSLNAILDTIPSLMNGLRMVWIISRHYNTDDQMLPLMKRIVNELVDKVSSDVSTPPLRAFSLMNRCNDNVS
jgi:hypothetical protein